MEEEVQSDLRSRIWPDLCLVVGEEWGLRVLAHIPVGSKGLARHHGGQGPGKGGGEGVGCSRIGGEE